MLLSVNGKEIRDVFDYRFLTQSEELTLQIRKTDGEEWELDIEKDEEEDLGLQFGSGLMDEYRSCSNHCIFCFIDQMPKGLRKTLYFKDDDARLSFLQGNYVTLTNMRDEDLERVIRYRLQPINISVHTTNPGLRVEMLRNRFAGEALKKIDRLHEAGITMNGQIVLCKGINDGEELERTIRDLSGYLPNMQSLSVVPVGLTRYREGLYPLEPFTREDATEVLSIIRREQERCIATFGTHFVHAGDEWYLLAGEELPPAENYDEYLQLENGVGMLRLLIDEFSEALSAETGDPALRTSCSVACGVLVAPFMEKLTHDLQAKYPGVTVRVYPIRNDFFGERITVSGLLTGGDLITQLSGRELGERLLITRNMLRFGEDVLLDDVHVSDLERALGIAVEIVDATGAELLACLKGKRSDGPCAAQH